VQEQEFLEEAAATTIQPAATECRSLDQCQLGTGSGDVARRMPYILEPV